MSATMGDCNCGNMVNGEREPGEHAAFCPQHDYDKCRGCQEEAAATRLSDAAEELAVIVRLVCIQFTCAGIAPVKDSNDPTEALHFRARAVLAKIRGES